VLKIGKLYKTTYATTLVMRSRLPSYDAQSADCHTKILPQGTLFIVVDYYPQRDFSLDWPVYKIIVGDQWYYLQDNAKNFREQYKQVTKDNPQ